MNFRNQFIAATAMFLVLVMIATWTDTVKQSKGRDKKLHMKGTSSPAKVLSIFELAKTAYIDGHTEEVMKLVDRLKFDVNFPIPTTGMSLFLCACISGERNLVNFLLRKGGDTSSVNSDGDSCLYLATFATVNGTGSSLIELLIRHGCKVNGQNYRGNTALHLAASRGNARLVQTLLNHSADPVRANNVGISPFDCAANAGHKEIAEMLERYTYI
ncbi:ankyrin repeat domain-containing protein 22-like [Amphiura filiformis]|uniref:ankyrin repeat domain-containing protein 22-like n=1 Tax=Amphiura filiformis TaxID=82378 RepID=UPI003B2239F0